MNERSNIRPESVAARQNQARRLLADFVRQSDDKAGSHDELLKSHPALREELLHEIRKLSLIHGALQRVAEPQTLGLNENVYCPTCHESVSPDSLEVDGGGGESTRCMSCGETFTVARQREPSGVTAGQRFGHFELLERVGVGGFGTVWRVADTRLDRIVALKLPRSTLVSEEDTAAFLREARTAAQLTHPNIVRVHEVGRHGESVFIVSDLIDGISLAERLAIRAYSTRKAAAFCATVASAMHYAHSEGVVHRDLKPQNILTDADETPFVTDFGLARRDAVDITVTTDGAILGTPAFMAPEQARGQSHTADRRTDVYALGAILFQMLTGELPFRGGAADVLRQVVDEPPPRPRRLNSHIPIDLETICLKCLEKKPEQRYDTMAELADDLRRWLDRKPIGARPIGSAGRALRWCQRKPALAAALGLLTLAILAGFAGVTWQLHQTEAALARADNNKQQSWELIQEFLVDLSQQDLVDQPRMGEVRARLLKRAGVHFERLATENVGDEKSQFAVANARRLLGDLTSQHGDFNEGLSLINQSLDSLLAMERLETSKAIQEGIVGALIARGQLASFEQDQSLGIDAVADWQNARQRIEVLITDYPADREFLHWRADVLAKLGWQQRKRRDPAAVSTLQSAIEACHDLQQYDDYRLRALTWLGKCHTDLAEYHLGRGEVELGIDHARLALKAVRDGLELNPDEVDLRSTFCAASHSLGVALLGSNRPAEAIPVFENAIDVRRQLAEDFPKQQYYRSHLATLTYYLASAFQNSEFYDDAQAYLTEAVEIRRALHADFPDDVNNRVFLAGALGALADVQMKNEAHDESLETVADALGLLDELPESLMTDINRCLILAQKSATLVELGRSAEAMKVSEESVSIADKFVNQNPSDPHLNVMRVSVQSDLINALQESGLPERALAEIERGLPGATAALKSESAESRASGQSFFAAAGAARLAASDPEMAMPWLELALSDLSIPNPQANDWMRTLIDCYEQVGRNEDAEKWRRELIHGDTEVTETRQD